MTRYAPAWVQRTTEGGFIDLRTNQHLKGLKAALARKFWPGWQPWRAQRRSQYGSTMEEGNRVEEQVAAVLEGQVQTARNRHARAVCEWVKEQRLELVGSQVVLHDPISRITTAIDFVFRDLQTAELVVVELKVGYCYKLGTTQGTMAGGLERVPLSLKNQCYAQLVWELQVLLQVYGVKARGELLVSGKHFQALRATPRVSTMFRPLLHLLRPTRPARRPASSDGEHLPGPENDLS